MAALAACIAACELSQLTFVSPRAAAAPRWMKLDQIASGSLSGMPATIDQDPPARA